MRRKHMNGLLFLILFLPANTIWANSIDQVVKLFETRFNVADRFSLTGPIENDREARVPGNLNFITTTASDYSIDQVKAIRSNLNLIWRKIPPNIRIRLEVQKTTLSSDSNDADVDVVYWFIAREGDRSGFTSIPRTSITMKMRKVDDAWYISNMPKIIDHIAGLIQAVPRFQNSFQQVTIFLGVGPFVHDFRERPILFRWEEDVSSIQIQLTAVSSDPSVASVEISNDRLTVIPLAVGESTITLNARSSIGHEISQSFEAAIRLDQTAPLVTGLFAADGATDIDPVVVNREGFYFTFSEQINIEKIQTSVRMGDQILMWLPIWSDGNKKLTLKPSNHQVLDFETQYHITLSQVQDLSKNVADELVITFSTSALGEGVVGPIALDLNPRLGDQEQRQSYFIPKIGDQIIVDVVGISGAWNNLGFQVKLRYDSIQLEWVGFQAQDIFAFGTVVTPDPADGIVEVSVTFMNNRVSEDTGSLGHAIFKVSESFKDEARVELISASYDRPVAVGTGGAVVIIGGVIDKTPDFNGDGMVNFADFIEFGQNYGKTEEDADFNTRYDLNNDSSVDFKDFLLLAHGFGKAV